MLFFAAVTVFGRSCAIRMLHLPGHLPSSARSLPKPPTTTALRLPKPRAASIAPSWSRPPAAGIENEVEQGFAKADAFADAKVGHVVFSSVGSAHRQTGIPHFDSKFRIEQRLKARGIPHTVSGPAYFMENLLFPDTVSGIASGTLGIAMPADRKLQMQAVSDIGEFSASLFERRDDVIGKRIDIAADELSGNELAAILANVTGKPVSYLALSPDIFRPAMEDLALMVEWFDRVGYEANIESPQKRVRGGSMASIRNLGEDPKVGAIAEAVKC